MATKKYLSYDGLQEYDALLKAEIAEKDAQVLEDAKSDVITVNGGGSLVVGEIFGEAPYVIEANFEEEENLAAYEIEYNGSASGLSATDVQGAIDELKSLSEVAPNGTDYSTYRIRNIAILSEIPTVMNNGDVALVYKKEA